MYAVKAILLSLLFQAVLAGAKERVELNTVAAANATLQQDINAIDTRLSEGRSSRQQVIADAERISDDYSRLMQDSKFFSPADWDQNKQSARRVFGWLCRSGAAYRNDPLVSQSLMRTYGTIGNYYSRYGLFYPTGAGLGYEGASRHARSLILGVAGSKQYERDLIRFATAWAAASYIDQALSQSAMGCRMNNSDQYDFEAPGQQSLNRQLPFPEVDKTKLTGEQLDQLAEIHSLFMLVSARVHEARTLLEQLSSRLHDRGMKLNPQDAATAITMQGFLEDAVEYVKSGDFEKAKAALTRSDYLRKKLKHTTGQQP
jgi:hypothetical protein